MTELLSPAGSLASLQTALHFGADAVYIGAPLLQLRAPSAAFSLEEVEKAVDATHARGKKLYVALNAFAHPNQFQTLPQQLQQLADLSVDGLIVSDLGVFAVARERCPSLEIHISTQANCLNAEAAALYHALGAARVVLARELSIVEIAQIRAQCPPSLVLEAFVHGAMCMAYAGRCFLSAHLIGRDANQGDCAQACRWHYRVEEETRPGQSLPVEESTAGTAIFSSADLCMLSHLDALQKAGVSSFKIEGRMKSPYYVATVTDAYRRALDHTAPTGALEQALHCASHRPFSTGFYFGPPAPGGDVYRQDCLYAASVLDRQGDLLYVEQRNAFGVGDTLEVLSPNFFGQSFVVESLYDQAGQPIGRAPHAQQRLTLRCPYPLERWDILRKRISP